MNAVPPPCLTVRRGRRLGDHARRRTPNRPRQRGAIGLVGAVTLLLAFILAALSIDSGRLWLERRSLQRVADMAALEAARFTGCGSTPTDALKAASASASRNGLKALAQGDALTLQRGRISTDAAGLRQFIQSPADDDTTDAIKVQAYKRVPSSMVLGGLFGDQVLLSAEATAQGAPPTTAFTLGSAVVAINPDSNTMINGLLGGILGSKVDLSLGSYQGLAAAKVDVLKVLSLQGGVGTIEDLLNANIGLGDAIDLFGKASDSQDPATGLGLSQLIRAANLSGKTIKLGDVLSVGTPSEPALTGVNVNLLNLIVVAVQVSNDQTGYFNLPVSFQGIGAVQLQMGSKPSIAIGPPGRSSRTGQWCTEAKTASMNLVVQIDALDNLGKMLGGLLKFDMRVEIQGAPAKAHVNGIQMSAGTSHVEMGVTTGVIGIKITNRAETGPATIGLDILGKFLGVRIWTDPARQTGYALLDVPVETPVEEHLPQSAQGSQNASGVLSSVLGDQMHLELDVGFPISLDMLFNGIIKGLATILEKMVDPLIQITGMQPGAAMVDVFYLGGAQPRLVR